MVERFADVVVLEMAVAAADRVGAAILAGCADELLGAGVGDQGQTVALRAGVRRRIVRLQAGVDVERSKREAAQCRGYRGAERHKGRAKAENLHLERVAGDSGRVE